jgi:hypothetical protein
MKKSKILLVLVFSVLASTCFYSCDKAGQLEGTFWEGGNYQSELFNWNFTNTVIYFETTSRASIKVIDILSGDVYRYTSASYSCKGNKITLTVGAIPNHQTWSGKVKKRTMTLDNVFGETVEFKQL